MLIDSLWATCLMIKINFNISVQVYGAEQYMKFSHQGSGSKAIYNNYNKSTVYKYYRLCSYDCFQFADYNCSGIAIQTKKMAIITVYLALLVLMTSLQPGRQVELQCATDGKRLITVSVCVCVCMRAWVCACVHVCVCIVQVSE